MLADLMEYTGMKEKVAAPPELDDEALLEWERLTTELESLGLLNTADRALMVLVCQTYAINQKMLQHISQHGATKTTHNKETAQTPESKIYLATTKQLATMLKQLGLTPAARGIKASEGAEIGELQY